MYMYMYIIVMVYIHIHCPCEHVAMVHTFEHVYLAICMHRVETHSLILFANAISVPDFISEGLVYLA